MFFFLFIFLFLSHFSNSHACDFHVWRRIVAYFHATNPIFKSYFLQKKTKKIIPVNILLHSHTSTNYMYKDTHFCLKTFRNLIACSLSRFAHTSFLISFLFFSFCSFHHPLAPFSILSFHFPWRILEMKTREQ